MGASNVNQIDSMNKSNKYKTLEKINDFVPIGLIVLGIGTLYLVSPLGNYFISIGLILYGMLELLLFRNWSAKVTFRLIGRIALLLFITLLGVFMAIFGLNFILVLPLILLDRFLFPRKESTATNK